MARPGHFQSYDRSGNRHVSDRFESTAAIGRRPFELDRSPKRSPTARQRRSAPGAPGKSGVRAAEQALPTICCPSRRRGQRRQSIGCCLSPRRGGLTLTAKPTFSPTAGGGVSLRPVAAFDMNKSGRSMQSGGKGRAPQRAPQATTCPSGRCCRGRRQTDCRSCSGRSRVA